MSKEAETVVLTSFDIIADRRFGAVVAWKSSSLATQWEAAFKQLCGGETTKSKLTKMPKYRFLSLSQTSVLVKMSRSTKLSIKK